MQFNKLYKLILQSIITEDIESKIRKAIQTLIKSGQIKDQNDPRIEQVKTIIKRNNSIDINGKTKLDQLLKANQTLIKREQNKNFNLDSIKQLTDKQEYEDGVVVYRVDDTEEGMNAVRKIVDVQWGKKSNPWCLITPPMDKAWEYWCRYSQFPKQIAFQNGKLLAFRANTYKNNLWWDRQDKSSTDLKLLDGKTLDIPTLKWNPKNQAEKIALKLCLKYNKETQRYDCGTNLSITNDDLINGCIPVPLGVIKKDFDISYCNELKNLDNGPTHVWGRLITYRAPSKIVKASQMYKNYLEEADRRCIEKNNLKFNKKTGNYYSDESVWIWDYMLKDGHFPVKFDYVKKDFNCSYNTKLTSLEGAPRTVGGNFYIGGCISLTSLKGGPEKVGGDYDCWKCKSLVDSTGAPKEVGGDFDYRECPKEFENSADLKNFFADRGSYLINKLIKEYKLVLNKETGRYDCNGQIRLRRQNVVDGHLPLKFGKVTGDFDCSMADLVSLDETPTQVGGNFDIAYNNITSLKNAPKKIGGDFDCHSCSELISLEGAPQKVGGDFNIERCYKLTSLKGAPKIIGRDFNCKECNQLVSLLDDGPQKIKGDIIMKNCPKLSMKERNQFKRKVSH